MEDSEAQSELIIGLVGALGVDFDGVIKALESQLKQFGYTTNPIHLSKLLQDPNLRKIHEVELRYDSEVERIESHMNAGDRLRQKTGKNDILAVAASVRLHLKRVERLQQGQPPYMPETTTVFRSLKRPEEVFRLRSIYGDGFWLIGVYSDAETRKKSLIRSGVPDEDVDRFIERDEFSDEEGGQATRATFELADAFIRYDCNGSEAQLDRLIRLIFGDQYETPTPDEHAMYLAYAASFRSGDLSRQVGAAMTDKHGDVVAVGANDVPRAGGGLYWPNEDDERDRKRGYDSNDRERDKLIEDILRQVEDIGIDGEKSVELKRVLYQSRLSEITEYGRTVHAEMDAILACARIGVSPRGGTLYTTTFPCHNCARHIVASGISRVVYLEPYPKSRASALHDDSITFEKDEGAQADDRKVLFEPFIGVSARRYMDLFSMKLGLGYEFEGKYARKDDEGNVKSPNKEVRVKMRLHSYLDTEKIIAADLEEIAP